MERERCHSIKTIPDYKSGYGVDELSDYELEDLKGVDEAWYWYGSEQYEGSGYMIYQVGKRYGFWYMGHCSCYGPTDDFVPDAKYPSVRKLMESVTDDAAKWLWPVVREFNLIGD